MKASGSKEPALNGLETLRFTAWVSGELARVLEERARQEGATAEDLEEVERRVGQRVRAWRETMEPRIQAEAADSPGARILGGDRFSSA